MKYLISLLILIIFSSCSTFKHYEEPSKDDKIIILISFTHNRKILENKEVIHIMNNTFVGYFIFAKSSKRQEIYLRPHIYHYGDGDFFVFDNPKELAINTYNLHYNTNYMLKCKFKKGTKAKSTILLIWEGKEKCGQSILIHIIYNPHFSL